MSPVQSVSRFQLNPHLNTSALGVEFKRAGRLQVADVLHGDGPHELYGCLQSLEWTLLIQYDERSYEVPAERGGSFAANRHPMLKDQVYAAAGVGFAYAYERAARTAGKSVLDGFTEFLNSPRFRGFMGSLTGIGDFQRVSSQVTCFRPGHFLNFHYDADRGKSIAYVLNLNPEWKAEWGGILQFADEAGTICDCLVPRFNTLCLFAVPQLHAVSLIAPYAPAVRYAISGCIGRPSEQA
jgi:SM-20-related protein